MVKEHWIKFLRVSVPKFTRLVVTFSSFDVALL